jgi:hypothetical protein
MFRLDNLFPESSDADGGVEKNPEALADYWLGKALKEVPPEKRKYTTKPTGRGHETINFKSGNDDIKVYSWVMMSAGKVIKRACIRVTVKNPNGLGYVLKKQPDRYSNSKWFWVKQEITNSPTEPPEEPPFDPDESQQPRSLGSAY